jgi:hypothetical protein
LCRGSGEHKCTSSDPHAGFDGAFKCLDAAGDFAFLRDDTVRMSTYDINTGADRSDVRYLYCTNIMFSVHRKNRKIILGLVDL